MWSEFAEVTLNTELLDWKLETTVGALKVSTVQFLLVWLGVYIRCSIAAVTRKTRILDVVYNASNNELVRTKTLVKNAIVQIDATPFRSWYEQHYGVKIGLKKKSKQSETVEEEAKKSEHVQHKHADRQKTRTLDPALDDAFASGRLLAAISSRPGQSGRSDGYILEGKELEFYAKALKRKK